MKCHVVYLLFALIFGSYLALSIPPLMNSDETEHFVKANEISMGIFAPHILADGNLGNYIPEDLNQYRAFMMGAEVDSQTKHKMQTSQLAKEIRVDYSKCIEGVASVSDFNCFFYIVPAIGIKIVRIYSSLAGQLPSLYGLSCGARISCLIVYSFFVFLCLRKLPKFKKSACIISLMPSQLVALSSVHYDAIMLIAILTLFVSVMRLRYTDQQLNVLHFILFGFVLFVLFTLKYVYVFSLSLLLLIPKEKVRRLKNPLKYFLLSVIVCVLLSVVLNFQVVWMNLHGVRKLYSNQLNSEQLEFVVKNPIHFIGAVINSLILTDFYVVNYVGNFGSFAGGVAEQMAVLYIVLLFLVAYAEGESLSLCLSRRIILICSFLATFLSLFLAMYLTWTPVFGGGIHTETVVGVQGRYFVPATIILFPVLSHLRKTQFSKFLCKVSDYSVIVPVIYGIYFCVLVHLRFFG